MARAFGLGQKTGIDQIPEEAGQIEDPPDPISEVNQAIGQGTVLVTPLQVARFIAAIGNGGTLYRPQLVEKIEPVDGGADLTVFKPEAQGTLPIQPFRLQAIQDAMRSVVADSRGTANFRLRGLQIPVAGKTGTAESSTGKPHAWFAGYTMAGESTGLPDIAIAVILEYQGEGSDWAAPIFQRIVESYYYGSPRSILWFESNFGVTETPTPLGGIPTKTPKPNRP
jgi:penicillin-binding protein 2